MRRFTARDGKAMDPGLPTVRKPSAEMALERGLYRWAGVAMRLLPAAPLPVP